MMFYNKGTRFTIIAGDTKTRVSLSQNLWTLQKGSKFRDEIWGCLKVTEMSDDEKTFKAIPISYKELNS